MPKRPVNLTLNETVIGFAERIMEATGESSMVGLVEQLIRAEYERRNGPIQLSDVSSALSLNDKAVAPFPAIVTAPIKIYRHKRSKTNP